MSITAAKRARNPHQPVGRWIRPEKRLAIYLRDGFRCLLCWRDLAGETPWQVTLDHVVAIARGGSNEPSNLYTCCRSCNSSRQDSPIRGDARRSVRSYTRRSIARYLVAARALSRLPTWSETQTVAGAVARAYRAGAP